MNSFIIGERHLELDTPYLFLPSGLERTFDHLGQLSFVPQTAQVRRSFFPLLSLHSEASLSQEEAQKATPVSYRGRYLILPQAEQQFLNVHTKVMLIGTGKSYELWNPDVYERYDRLNLKNWDRLAQLKV